MLYKKCTKKIFVCFTVRRDQKNLRTTDLEHDENQSWYPLTRPIFEPRTSYMSKALLPHRPRRFKKSVITQLFWILYLNTIMLFQSCMFTRNHVWIITFITIKIVDCNTEVVAFGTLWTIVLKHCQAVQKLSRRFSLSLSHTHTHTHTHTRTHTVRCSSRQLQPTFILQGKPSLCYAFVSVHPTNVWSTWNI
jgi:hypothetical protein